MNFFFQKIIKIQLRLANHFFIIIIMNHFKKFLHLKIISRQSAMYIGRCPIVALQAHQKKKKKKKKEYKQTPREITITHA
jgi:hypothetical protein